ncbi:hypothetical protein [Gloeobacter morelensis]|uniref:hypothetical protein n=1 Tax=Gloeobacter morelensis TaxID=2907343 RepID=UPI001E445430|nr:hypothetical protein [Gloeobacter morelensis]UFP97219.1 hypothetical protein ISF26_24160 [Gloeobacter morelensis MG652769]
MKSSSPFWMGVWVGFVTSSIIALTISHDLSQKFDKILDIERTLDKVSLVVLAAQEAKESGVDPMRWNTARPVRALGEWPKADMGRKELCESLRSPDDFAFGGRQVDDHLRLTILSIRLGVCQSLPNSMAEAFGGFSWKVGAPLTPAVIGQAALNFPDKTIAEAQLRGDKAYTAALERAVEQADYLAEELKQLKSNAGWFRHLFGTALPTQVDGYLNAFDEEVKRVDFFTRELTGKVEIRR